MKTIIIAGAARSGTKMLGNIFSMYKGVTYYGEVNHMWRTGNEKVNHDILPVNDEVVSSIRKKFYEKHIDGNTLVEKTAANSLRLPLVAKVFENVKIIHIVRDGRDVALSALQKWQGRNSKFEREALRYKNSKIEIPKRVMHRVREMSLREIIFLMPKGFNMLLSVLGFKRDSYWGPLVPGIKDIRKTHSLLETCAYQWRICEEFILNFIENNRHIPVYEVKYEELCKNPEDVLKGVLEFCDMEVPDNFQDMKDSIKGGNLEKWKSEIDRDDLIRVQDITSFLLKYHGYELNN